MTLSDTKRCIACGEWRATSNAHDCCDVCAASVPEQARCACATPAPSLHDVACPLYVHDAEAYRVEPDDDGLCAACGKGRQWSVIGPDEVAEGVTFGEEVDALEYAAALNSAFEQGLRASRKGGANE